ncbi:RNA-binding protein [Pseudoclavibacter sp. 13-3]|uniref:RNA-binding protein n=1 Tax=Pseudoclavibacter sp. 13-3 TaxID=2901228 RepID=UPI001E4A809E|nr:RNA-binding protein [Pseudoclavibacter sp. 13-3]MCD7100892.1 RNA-binding protein [Pseudoclavibacter sp. 13-3]
MLQQTVDHLVRGIVSSPDDVTVDERHTARADVIDVRVAPDDLGRVIGRSGRTAQALRTVVDALADGRRVRVNIVDTDA